MSDLTHADIAPTAPRLDSGRIARRAASPLLRFEYYEPGPGSTPPAAMVEHCLLLNFGRETIHLEVRQNGHELALALKPGDGAAAPAGLETAWRWRQPLKVGMIWVCPHALATFIETEMDLILDGSRLDCFRTIRDPRAYAIARRIHHTLRREEIGREVMFDALSRAFLVTLVRNYGLRSPGDHASGELGHAAYRRVLAMMRSDLTNGFGTQDMADAAGMGRTTFTRRFSAATGRSPSQFAMEFRLREARRALARPEQSIAQVAAACGFADQAHLTRRFRLAYGVTPGTFRAARSN